MAEQDSTTGWDKETQVKIEAYAAFQLKDIWPNRYRQEEEGDE
jgi:hypothetical protein